MVDSERLVTVGGSRLIQPPGWNPVGESMYGILARLSDANLLNWKEFRNSFGPNSLTSFQKSKAQAPDNPENFPLLRIALLLGWSPDVFSASFSEFYKPYWMSSDGAIPVHDRLRICSQCLLTGSHLVVHQFLDIERCPIHNCELNDRLPCCNRLTRPYRIEAPFENALGCDKCEVKLQKIPFNAELQRQRERFVADYRAWTNTFESLLNSEESQLLWLDGPRSYRDMIVLNEYVPGPDWIASSFAKAKFLTRTRHAWVGPRIRPRPAVANSAIKPCYGLQQPWGRGTDAPYLIQRYLDSMRAKIRKFNTSLKDDLSIANTTGGIFELNSSQCTPEFGDSSVWNAAYWLWRRYLDAAFPIKSRRQRSRTLDFLGESSIWERWALGPGSLTYSRLGGHWQMENADFVRWFSSLWFRDYLETTYTLFVGTACRELSQGWLNTHNLGMHADAVGDYSRYLIVQNEQQTFVDKVATVAPFTELKLLQCSGVNFLDHDVYENFDRFRLVQDILGMSAYQRQTWLADWKYAQDIVRKRRIARSCLE